MKLEITNFKHQPQIVEINNDSSDDYIIKKVYKETKYKTWIGFIIKY